MAHFGKDLDNFSASRTIQITHTETNENFTSYTIEVTVGSYTWTVKHRYSEFHELHEKLTANYKLDRSLLPPKKLFGNQTEAFIRKRQNDLQVYLQTVLHYLAHHPPPCLTFFLDFHLYEIHGITQALAEDLYNRGEVILQTKEVYQMTPLQLYSLTERLKLPEPTCDSGDVKKDLGHILDFITRAKHLQICGQNEQVGTSNINMNQLKFDLSLFKSLQSLEVIACNLQMVGGLETIKQTLETFNIYRSAKTVKEIVLQDAPRWKGEDGTQLVGGWDHVTRADFSHNFITQIDNSVQILWRVETLDLSHNHLEGVQHLHLLSQLTHLDLSHNRLRILDSLHTKLGNLKSLILAGNLIESLQGFSKLFSLEMLDVRNNKISKLEDVRPVCQLPCMEKLLLTGNAVTMTVDYRTKVLEMFGDRVDEVYLDNEKATQKEKDTVAVLQALQKAREAKPRQNIPRKTSSSASLSDVYGRGETPPPVSGTSLPRDAPGNQSTSAVGHLPWVSSTGSLSGMISSSAPQHTTPQPWSQLDSRSTRQPFIYVPARQSPSQASLSSCTSAQEMVIEGEVCPVPEAHPFDPNSDSGPSLPLRQKEQPRKYSIASLPTAASKAFISWLESRLLSDDTASAGSSITAADTSFDVPVDQTADHVVDIMWCDAQQYSSPSATVFPGCAILTKTKVIVERLSVAVEESGFPGTPDFKPCIILPLCSIQHMVIGPCHAYLRLEEAFVGKGGLFTLFASETAVLKRFSASVKERCMQLDASNPVDISDLSHQSDLLAEIHKREEGLSLPSDRLAFVQLIRVREKKDTKICMLVLSENKVYCVDPACVYWPPATFETAHEGSIHLKIIHEFSIVDDIADLALHGDSAETTRSLSNTGRQIEFTRTALCVQITTKETQRELVFEFSSPNSRDMFLDRLTNLRAEHAHRMSPTVREAPEGGNESLDVVDSHQHQDVVGSQQHSDPPLPPTTITAERKFSDRSPQSDAVVKHKVGVSLSGSSLPSSLDWQQYCFTASSNSIAIPPSTLGVNAQPLSASDFRSQASVALEDAADYRDFVNDNYLTDIQSSGEIDESSPTAFEEELREAVKSYGLLQPMPARLRPISLMSGREVVAFFRSKVAGASSTKSSPSDLKTSPNELKVSAGNVNTSPEELRCVFWTAAVPYSDPAQEIVTLVMLSTRAIYLVSDASTSTTNANARPSWMTHARNKSDSAVTWQTSASQSHLGVRGGSGRQWSKVKSYAVLLLSDLVQVSVGLFDQFLRLTGPDAQTVFTLATRDPRQTSAFVEKLKAALSLLVSSPNVDKTPDIEQDFYHAFAKRTNSTVEGLVYTHPSQVTFVYPGDDAVEDVLFLIKARVQVVAEENKENKTKKPSSPPNNSSPNKEILWLYILGYQIMSTNGETPAAGLAENSQPRTIIITSTHLCLAREDIVTYPLPDFVRGLPEQPQHEIVEARRLESLKRIILSITNPHTLSLVFWDEPEELVVDSGMQHFGRERRSSSGSGRGRGIVPEVVLRLYVQSVKDKDKLIQIVQKQWRELVPQVGRILDVVRE